MDTSIVYVFRANAQTIKMALIDAETNKGYDLSDITTVEVKIGATLNSNSSYETSKTASVTSESDGEFEVSFAATDFTSVGDYYYGIFLDDVLVAQGKFIVKDSIIV